MKIQKHLCFYVMEIFLAILSHDTIFDSLVRLLNMPEDEVKIYGRLASLEMIKTLCYLR